MDKLRMVCSISNLKLVYQLGEKHIDSILLEGGQTLNYAALEAGIVQYLYCYIGAKLFGGISAFTPVGGQGVATPSDAFFITNTKISSFDGDILIEGTVK